jgi:hypothetical protein
MTAAYRLPARFVFWHREFSLLCCDVTLCRRVIHTVAPRYKPHYRTAAENALHHCYRNAFTMIKVGWIV